MVQKRMHLDLYVSLDELITLKCGIEELIRGLEDNLLDKNEPQIIEQLKAARAMKCKLDVTFHG